MIKRTTTAKTSSRSTKIQSVAPELETQSPAPPTRNSGYARALPIALILVVLLGGTGYLVRAAMQSRSGSNSQDLQVREGVDPQVVANVINRVRELVAVTADELPTVATIQDITVLRPQNPTLYRDAQNGDKLLVWSDKVVVYSSNMDRVLVAMPINLGPDTSQAAPNANTQVAAATAATAAAEAEVTIEVRNGTETAGAARVLSDKLKAEGFSTLAPADAKNKTYTSTVIYNATGKSVPKTLEKLVASTGGRVVTAVEGEASTKADLLIIVGSK